MHDNTHHHSKDHSAPHCPNNTPPCILLHHTAMPITNIVTDIVIVDQWQCHKERPPCAIPHSKACDNSTHNDGSKPRRAKNTLYTLKQLLHILYKRLSIVCTPCLSDRYSPATTAPIAKARRLVIECFNSK